MRTKSVIILLYCFLNIFMLSSCNFADTENQQISSVPIKSDTVYSSVTTSNILYDNTSDNTEINLSEMEKVPLQTTTVEYVDQLVNSVEFPKININANSTSEEIMISGEKAAKFFAELTEKYFGYGIEYKWKLSQNDDDYLQTEKMKQYQTSGIYWRSLGLYTDTKDAYVPMNGNESKQFLIDYLGLTEKGYEELCENSPSTYTINDGNFYVSSGDGGQAGWSYSQIIDYAVSENELGEKVVTYNCERVGDAEEWGYDEDLIQPFNFRLAFEDNTWKLDGVSYGEGFFELKWLLN